MNDLLLVIPSRGRPGNMERLLDSMERTCRADTEILVGVDHDDPRSLDYSMALAVTPFQNWHLTIKDGLHQVVPWLNALALPEANNYRYIGHVGDDQGTPTVGWDVRVIEALERQPFAFVDDEYPTREKGTLCCHIFTRSEVVRKLGYFAIPECRHMFSDVAWMAWGKACGIEFLSDVSWPHEHYTIGGNPVDASYIASNSWTGNDLRGWNEYAHNRLNADIEKLGGIPYSPKALAQFKLDLNVPCEVCQNL